MRERRRRATAALLTVAAVATVAGLIAGAAQAPPTDPPGSFVVSVSRAPVTRPLASDFLGLAVEYNTVQQWVGSPTGPINPPLVQLIHNLQPAGRPLIRIGGQSSDRSWWPVPGLSQPRGVTTVLDSNWTKSAHALAKALDARLMLGLNLEANRTRIPEQEARRLVAGVGSQYVASLQLGNEPELYLFTPWYRVLNGKRIPWYSTVGKGVYSRRAGYSPADFTSEYGRVLPLLPNIPLAGPETGNPLWMQQFLQFLSPRSRVRMLTYHVYGNNGCYKSPSQPLYPTIPHLLAPYASRDLLNGFDQFIGDAHRDGASFRIDEMGSVTCNGRPGVSDTMASALWAMDALFAVARSGVDGVNLHSYPGSVNGLFDFTQKKNGQWTATVHPLYYGALMFARAAPPGSRLLHITAGDQTKVRVWATIGADHRVRVLLVNTGQGRVDDTRVVVHAPTGYGSKPAALQRLRAPGVAATSGLMLGGRTFGQTTTGVLGDPVPQTTNPSSGTYNIKLPGFSAALLVLSPR